HRSGSLDWSHRRLEASARSMLDSIAVWAREMARPEGERSPTTLAHETARTQRMADHFESEIARPELRDEASMAPWVAAVALETARMRKMGDLTAGRPAAARGLARTDGAAAIDTTNRPCYPTRSGLRRFVRKCPDSGLNLSAQPRRTRIRSRWR